MKRTHLPRRALALLLAALLLCSACSGPDQLQEGDAAQATAARLRRSQGTVSVTDGEANRLEASDDLPLYGGYGLGTQAASYAWIDLDEVKLTKLDEHSGIDIQKEGKRLEITVNSGSLFFNITEPLAGDETLDIRTSTMLVGIRGTCGWVSAQEDGAQVYILEGTVSATVDRGQTAQGGSAGAAAESWSVTAGQVATASVGADGAVEVTVTDFPVQAVPGFVQVELEQDEKLAAAILDASGLDVLAPADPQTAYAAVLARYQDAQANALPYDEYGEDWEQMSRNHDMNQANYPDLGPAFLNYCLSGRSTGSLYYAYYDIDGNGTQELFIGTGWPHTDGIDLLEVHAFNGAQAVKLSSPDFDPEFCIYFCTPSADGLFIDYRGNGGMLSGIVYQLAADGYSLEPVTDSGIPAGGNEWDLDLSAHGGDLRELLIWSPFGQSASPEPEDAQSPLPTDGDRIVFTGTLNTYTYHEVLALQGVADPNAGYSDTTATYQLIVLDTPQEMALRSSDPTAGLRSGQVSLIAVNGMEQYNGQHLTFSIDPNSTQWPGGTDLPLGQPWSDDVHVLD